MNPEATAQQLMEALAGGELDAFHELVLRYQDLAWQMAYRFLGDSMAAEDVAHEAFIRVLPAARHYRPTAAFRTYFCRIITRLCLDCTRRKQPIGSANIPDVPDAALDPTESLIAKKSQVQVREAIDDLPPSRRPPSSSDAHRPASGGEPEKRSR